MNKENINDLINKTSKIFAIPIEDIKEKGSKKREIVEARQAVWLTLHRKHKLTLYAIRDSFNYKNHATILHGIRHAENLCELYPSFKNNVEFLQQ